MNFQVGIARRIITFLGLAEERRKQNPNLGGPVGGYKSKKKDKRKAQKVARRRNRR